MVDQVLTALHASYPIGQVRLLDGQGWFDPEAESFFTDLKDRMTEP